MHCGCCCCCGCCGCVVWLCGCVVVWCGVVVCCVLWLCVVVVCCGCVLWLRWPLRWRLRWRRRRRWPWPWRLVVAQHLRMNWQTHWSPRALTGVSARGLEKLALNSGTTGGARKMTQNASKSPITAAINASGGVHFIPLLSLIHQDQASGCAVHSHDERTCTPNRTGSAQPGNRGT